MDPLWTGTGASVRHANTYSDVGDHVAFGVDPPCDRQFFLSCRLLSARLSSRRESVWNRFGVFVGSPAALGLYRTTWASRQNGGQVRNWETLLRVFFLPHLPPSPHGSPLEKSLKLKLRVVVCLRPSRGSFRFRVVPQTPTRLWINILTCLAAWTLPAPAVSTCVLSQRFPTTS